MTTKGWILFTKLLLPFTPQQMFGVHPKTSFTNNMVNYYKPGILCTRFQILKRLDFIKQLTILFECPWILFWHCVQLHKGSTYLFIVFKRFLVFAEKGLTVPSWSKPHKVYQFKSIIVSLGVSILHASRSTDKLF